MPALVSRKHVCGCSSLGLYLIWISTSYLDFVISTTLAGVSNKGHFSPNITDDKGPIRLSSAVFSCSTESGVPAVSLHDFRVLTLVSLSTPLSLCGLFHEAPACEASSLIYLKRASFGVCLPPASLLSRRKACFYFNCGDLASLQGMLEEAYRAVRLSVAANRKDWPLNSTLLIFSIKDKRTVRCVVLPATAHSTWLELVDWCLCTWFIRQEAEWWRRCDSWCRSDDQ